MQPRERFFKQYAREKRRYDRYERDDDAARCGRHRFAAFVERDDVYEKADCAREHEPEDVTRFGRLHARGEHDEHERERGGDIAQHAQRFACEVGKRHAREHVRERPADDRDHRKRVKAVFE
ncbi:hypothetical protein SDC9_137442 [bioreactor metagenome]|uniref:Uncharacterized protein n=1 Tax=bioreactor metagenome TaxID=1076179 RepID=A0A645DM50_9ZZZZ